MSRRSNENGIVIECLACGASRDVLSFARHDIGECERCGYLGWACEGELTEPIRQKLHDRLAIRALARA